MKVFWLDCETTGLDPVQHGIISIGYIVEVSGEEKEAGVITMNPAGKAIDPKALEINHFTVEQIRTFQSAEHSYQQLRAILEKYVDKYNPHDKFFMAGYNVENFDKRFLEQLWKENADKYFHSYFEKYVLDPSRILPLLQYGGILKNLPPGLHLQQMAEYFGFSTNNAHTADADIRTTKAITLKLFEILHLEIQTKISILDAFKETPPTVFKDTPMGRIPDYKRYASEPPALTPRIRGTIQSD